MLYPNENIEEFQMLTNDSSYYYSVIYDSLGTKVFEDGRAFSNNVTYSYPKISVPINKIIKIQVLTTAIPNYKVRMKIGWQDSIKNRNPKNIFNIKDMTSSGYYTTFKKPGYYYPVFMGDLIDNEGKKIRSDTLTGGFKVVGK